MLVAFAQLTALQYSATASAVPLKYEVFIFGKSCFCTVCKCTAVRKSNCPQALCASVLTLVCSLTLLPLAIRYWTISEWPSSAAVKRGVKLSCI